jgi:excisionase family DNA binding protein
MLTKPPFDLKGSGPLTIYQVMAYLQVSRPTIYRLAKLGKLPIHKLAGRSYIYPADLARLLNKAPRLYTDVEP